MFFNAELYNDGLQWVIFPAVYRWHFFLYLKLVRPHESSIALSAYQQPNKVINVHMCVGSTTKTRKQETVIKIIKDATSVTKTVKHFQLEKTNVLLRINLKLVGWYPVFGTAGCRYFILYSSWNWASCALKGLVSYWKAKQWWQTKISPIYFLHSHIFKWIPDQKVIGFISLCN